MALEMVLNEHSIQEANAQDKSEAQKWMGQLVNTMKTAADEYGGVNLRTKEPIRCYELAKDYLVEDWQLDREVDRDIKAFFVNVMTRPYPWTDLPDLDEQVKGYEFTHPGGGHQSPEVCGLWVSHRVKAIAISLPSHLQWDSNELDMGVRWLKDDGNIKDENVKVKHASKPEHLEEHEQWINDLLPNDDSDGKDFWRRREQRFPKLSFCKSFGKTIRDLKKKSEMLNHIEAQLSDLDKHCKEWEKGGFDKEGLSGNPRLDSTSTVDQFKNERTFVCPDGLERTFSWHVSLPSNWRLYFWPDETCKRMIVGYVGEHLNTRKHKAN